MGYESEIQRPEQELAVWEESQGRDGVASLTHALLNLMHAFRPVLTCGLLGISRAAWKSQQPRHDALTHFAPSHGSVPQGGGEGSCAAGPNIRQYGSARLNAPGRPRPATRDKEVQPEPSAGQSRCRTGAHRNNAQAACMRASPDWVKAGLVSPKFLTRSSR